MYDSSDDTREHIRQVRVLLHKFRGRLSHRAAGHDESKLEGPEKEAFDEFTPKLAATTYGSEEYKACLADLGPALEHHYAQNSHHPEHYRWHCAVCDGSFSARQAPASQWDDGTSHRFCPRCCSNGSVIWEAELMDKPEHGIHGMTLLDLVEMFCDWKAATLRHKDGDIRRSIELNQKRFGYSDDLKRILLNTVEDWA